MLMTMSGGRYDNRPWPPYYGTIDVPQWEADQLIGGQNAEYADEPELDRGYNVLETPDPGWEAKLKGEEPEKNLPETMLQPVSGDFLDDVDDDDFERDEPVKQKMQRPAPADNKAAWVEWAIANGANGNQASSQTKVQLISEYGKLA
jgi:hypothetical protein